MAPPDTGNNTPIAKVQMENDTTRKSGSTPKFSLETPKSPTNNSENENAVSMDVDESDSAASTLEYIRQLKEVDLIPELFNLLYDLQEGNVIPKDFDNNAGSIRVKLNHMRQVTRGIKGVDESIPYRQNQINSLEASNQKTLSFLSDFKKRVEGNIEEKGLNIN
ncbi:Piso0_003884 [Millerozyma farinosa CBS 7064]|uniref:Mediator of RNA polymerase II transcription subunit 9 n=1 Tax=Pichia sorbitophila (strain ATCC MYA-4447 / BCRC 22081 / CBS 7064 / NBRC 10061 / NRRL Y-12695) TaxID=559304 RepID=G8Y9S6_PICSO|nr:Piso0_003884 [Millerozyma farinosa CBS 7064]CCE84340.1 Piso0_003884 [Millerozyma farinosa CBS 7064]